MAAENVRGSIPHRVRSILCDAREAVHRFPQRDDHLTLNHCSANLTSHDSHVHHSNPQRKAAGSC